MKKFYVITLVCMLGFVLAQGQSYYWVGPSSVTPGDWNNSANWSLSSGGAGGADVPNSSAVNAIFDHDALVNVNLGTINLNSLTVSNSSYVTLIAGGAATINLFSQSETSQALKVAAASTLLDSVTTDVDFIINFSNNTKALISGTWAFNGVENAENFGPTFGLPAGTTGGVRVDINGKIYMGPKATPGSYPTGEHYLFFNAGSEFQVDRNGGNLLRATWDPNSTIRVTGNVTAGTTIATFGSPPPIGSVVYDCPNLTTGVSLSMLSTTIQGNMQVLNTGGQEVTLSGNGFGGNLQVITNNINGNLDISGNSKIVLASTGSANKTFVFNVKGDLNAGGHLFNLQKDPNSAIVTNSTTLRIGGNLNHTSGIFTSTGTRGSTIGDLYIIEFNGTAPQTISSSSGVIDNPGRQLTLKINNAAGVTLLTPLAVGRISFSSLNKGVLTTSEAAKLTIESFATNTLTINTPSNNGYVDGPMIRMTNAAVPYIFPTGSGGVLRYCEVTPSNGATSSFRAEYYPSTPPSFTSLASPISAINMDEYWVIEKVSGSANASVSLHLNGPIAGASANDGIFVARFNETTWVSEKGTNGTIITPGDAASGTAVSDVVTSFSPFTLAYAPLSSLPIYLVSFNARKVSNSSAVVNWNITSNSTPRQFEVLKSSDGRNFASIGSLNGTEGKLNYELIDNNLGLGTSYYRLRMLDIDGTVTYSKVIAIVNGVKGLLITSMMPTVVSSNARLNISSAEKGNLQLVVTDLHGRIISQQIAPIRSGNQEVPLKLQSLASGTYQVTGYFEGARTASIRFIKL